MNRKNISISGRADIVVPIGKGKLRLFNLREPCCWFLVMQVGLLSRSWQIYQHLLYRLPVPKNSESRLFHWFLLCSTKHTHELMQGLWHSNMVTNQIIFMNCLILVYTVILILSVEHTLKIPGEIFFCCCQSWQANYFS